MCLKRHSRPFGGKAPIAPLVWERFGRDLYNYVEPFVNSAAVALAAPYVPAHETWNDLNGYVCNYWRAAAADPDAVARAADWPIHECDLHARHAWLVRRQTDLTERLMGDPEYYDAKAAGWWLWGLCAYIGGGWCSGQGPWITSDDGRLVKHDGDDNAGMGIWRVRPHLGKGMGIHRQLPHMGKGMGINRKLPHLGNAGMGQCTDWSAHLQSMMRQIRDRLRRVRICCGDWSRVCGPTPTVKIGLTGVFLDPPYQLDGRDDVYDNYDAHPDGDNSEVFYRVVAWANERGDDPLLRIAVCGYYEAGLFPASWECVRWKANGGYGNRANGRGRENACRETVWFSPHCVRKPVFKTARRADDMVLDLPLFKEA